jgi:hypothetical protein
MATSLATELGKTLPRGLTQELYARIVDVPQGKGRHTARLPACHLDHEMHPRDHKPVVQEPELHMLATKRGAGIVLLAVAANLFEHLQVDFKVAPLGQEVERLTAIQVVVELAVGSEAGERPASYQATLP